MANPLNYLEVRLANSTSVPRDSIPNDTYQRRINSRCTPAQVLAERVAWAEAGLLADAFSEFTCFFDPNFTQVWIFEMENTNMNTSDKWVPTKDYQEAMDM